MSQQPNDQAGQKAYQTNVGNMPVPPDLKQLQDRLTAITVQIANTPSTHPTFAALQARQVVLQTAIAAYKPRDDAK